MELKTYLFSLVDRFEVHQVYKDVIETMIGLEKSGFKGFVQENFDDPRDRAALAMPYQVKLEYLDDREHVLNFLELLILKHREEKHGEDWDNRINELQNKSDYTTDELNMIADPEGFWSG